MTTGRGVLVWAVAAALPAAGFAAAWSALDEDRRTTLLAHALYWTMPVVLALWAAAGVRALRASATPWRQRLVRFGPGLAVAAVATAVVFAWLPVAMRTQFDESSLLGTSRCMHFERTAMMATGAVPSPAGLVVVDWNLDKRPPLFAFLVSLVHDVAGYRIANAFVVNAAVLFLLLALLACRTRRHLGNAAAMAAPLLVLGVPLVAVCATSAGFDLLATLLLAAVVTAAIDVHREPVAGRWTWLLANGLLFASARYGSILVLVVVAAIVAATVRRWPLDGLGRTVLTAAPALLTPLALLLVHARDPNFYFEAGGQRLVAFAHFVDHGGHFLRAWGRIAADSAFPGPLGLVSLVVFVAWLWRRRGGVATALVVLPTLAAVCIALAWFFGDVDQSAAARLFLPSAVLGALGPLLLLRLCDRRWLANGVLVAAAAWAGIRLHHVAGETVMPRRLPAVALDAVDAALAGMQPDPTRTLLVSTVAQYLIVRGYPAVPPTAFPRRGREHPVDDVVVLETPLDARLKLQVGDPRGLLQGARVTPLGRVEGSLPVAAWRLHR